MSNDQHGEHIYLGDGSLIFIEVETDESIETRSPNEGIETRVEPVLCLPAKGVLRMTAPHTAREARHEPPDYHLSLYKLVKVEGHKRPISVTRHFRAREMLKGGLEIRRGHRVYRFSPEEYATIKEHFPRDSSDSQ